MTAASTPPQQPVWLSLSFDVEQLGHQLCWLATEGKENLFETHGLFAGSLHLPKTRDLLVEVRGYGGKSLRSFQVISVGLVTVPSRHTHEASPFVGQAAGVTIVDDFPVADQFVFDPRIDRAYGIVANGKALRIGDQDGGWDLSAILTVRFTLVNEDGGTSESTRVFRFDPESQVGNGTR